MAITIDTNKSGLYREQSGQVSGTAVIHQLDPRLEYTVLASVDSAGTAAMKVEIDDTIAASFATMATVTDGEKSENFVRTIKGATAVGLDVSSGSFSIKVRRLEI